MNKTERHMNKLINKGAVIIKGFKEIRELESMAQDRGYEIKIGQKINGFTRIRLANNSFVRGER